jgi:hypothetical protein
VSERSKKAATARAFDLQSDAACDLDDLLHPAQAFSHPSEVVNDPDLSLNEKRAILASWASDACAIESAPALRRGRNGGRPVSFDDVVDALRILDKQAAEANRSNHYRRVLHKSGMFGRNRGRGDSGHGQPLH